MELGKWKQWNAGRIGVEWAVEWAVEWEYNASRMGSQCAVDYEWE